MKSPLVNPTVMTEKTKMIWCGIGCVSTSVFTLTYIINDAKQHASKQIN